MYNANTAHTFSGMLLEYENKKVKIGNEFEILWWMLAVDCIAVTERTLDSGGRRCPRCLTSGRPATRSRSQAQTWIKHWWHRHVWGDSNWVLAVALQAQRRGEVKYNHTRKRSILRSIISFRPKRYVVVVAAQHKCVAIKTTVFLWGSAPGVHFSLALHCAFSFNFLSTKYVVAPLFSLNYIWLPVFFSRWCLFPDPWLRTVTGRPLVIRNSSMSLTHLITDQTNSAVNNAGRHNNCFNLRFIQTLYGWRKYSQHQALGCGNLLELLPNTHYLISHNNCAWL